MLAWQKYNGFLTFRGLYWKLQNIANLKIKPFTNMQFYNISLKNFEMREYQINSIKSWISDVNTVGAGIVKAPTGSRKKCNCYLVSVRISKEQAKRKNYL